MGAKRYRLAIDFKTPEAMLAFFEDMQRVGVVPEDAHIREQDSLDTHGKSVQDFIVSREPGHSGKVERRTIKTRRVVTLGGSPL